MSEKRRLVVLPNLPSKEEEPESPVLGGVVVTIVLWLFFAVMIQGSAMVNASTSGSWLALLQWLCLCIANLCGGIFVVYIGKKSHPKDALRSGIISGGMACVLAIATSMKYWSWLLLVALIIVMVSAVAFSYLGGHIGNYLRRIKAKKVPQKKPM